MKYVIVRNTPGTVADTWSVLYPHTDEALSHHETEAEARAARERYKAADRRRKRNADRVDGYDRDDLGESPDY